MFKQAFTIIELLVVIAIIGILATLTFVAYFGIADTENTNTLIQNTSTAGSQIETYKSDNSEYPPSLSSAGASVDSPMTPVYNVSDDAQSYCLAVYGYSKYMVVSNLNHTPRAGFCNGATAVYTSGSSPAWDDADLTLTDNGDTSITATWDPWGGASQYTIAYSTSSNFASSTTTTVNNPTFTVSGLTYGSTYYFRVQATVVGITTAWADPASLALAINVTPTTAYTAASASGASWSASGCPTGTSYQYQWRWYDHYSGWRAFSAWGTVTSTGQLISYDNQVAYQISARCVAGSATGPASAANQSATYGIGIPTPGASYFTDNGTGAGHYTVRWAAVGCTAGYPIYDIEYTRPGSFDYWSGWTTATSWTRPGVSAGSAIHVYGRVLCQGNVYQSGQNSWGG